MSEEKTLNTQELVCQSPNYKPVHKHGFVGLIDTMGTDESIVRAARCSYGAGTKDVSTNRNLIRYLWKAQHSSCFEHVEVSFHIKLPIFVMRQFCRHRFFSINEYSGRYSIMHPEMYEPELDYIEAQSTDNKQGRSENSLSLKNKEGVQWLINAAHDHSKQIYDVLLNEVKNKREAIYDPYGSYEDMDSTLDEDFEGIARELARIVLPVSGYTECYAKIDLLNFLKFIGLRADPHAQREIQDLANAMFELVKESGIVPFAIEAFEDYSIGGTKLSKDGQTMLKKILQKLDATYIIENGHSIFEELDFSETKMSKREQKEFLKQLEYRNV